MVDHEEDPGVTVGLKGGPLDEMPLHLPSHSWRVYPVLGGRYEYNGGISYIAWGPYPELEWLSDDDT